MKQTIRRLRDTVGYQMNVMRFCPYPAKRRRACVIILPLMTVALPVYLTRLAILGIGAVVLSVAKGIAATVYGVFVECPREMASAWNGDEALSASRWEQYEDFRVERRASEALANG